MLDELTEEVANGYGLAALYLQNALLTALVVKGVLTMKDSAAICNGALVELQQMRPTQMGKGMSDSAQQILSILSRGWEKQAKGN
jgi:hypothetical protein